MILDKDKISQETCLFLLYFAFMKFICEDFLRNSCVELFWGGGPFLLFLRGGGYFGGFTLTKPFTFCAKSNKTFASCPKCNKRFASCNKPLTLRVKYNKLLQNAINLLPYGQTAICLNVVQIIREATGKIAQRFQSLNLQ